MKTPVNCQDEEKSSKEVASYALAMHRLAECIIRDLVHSEDNALNELVEYFTTHLVELHDWMEHIVLKDLYREAQEDRVKNDAVAAVRRQCMSTPCRNEKRGCVKVSCCSKWNWLLNSMDESVQKLVAGTQESPEHSSDWCGVSSLKGAALVDTIESLAVVLLGHPKGRIRLFALRQLDILSSLISLKRMHCGGAFQTGKERANFAVPTIGPASTAQMCSNDVSCASGGLYYPRVVASETLKELGEGFEEMFQLQNDRYMHFFSQISSLAISDFLCVYNKEQTQLDLRLSRVNFAEILKNSRPIEESKVALDDSVASLVSTPFGARCMSLESGWQLLIFVSTLALVLKTYCYRPGSALVRLS
ncbi:hypothetical protein, conserved (fragment), partial [Trypanosoma vivax Y486]